MGLRGGAFQDMTRCLSRWTLAAMLWIAFTPLARAEALAATVERWGLLGSWAVDCAARPDRDKGALLTYELRKDGRVMYRRDFGDAKDESEVVSATVNAEGLLSNVMVYFPSLHSDTRIRTDACRRTVACARSTIAASAASPRSGTANTSRPAHRHPPQQTLRLTIHCILSEFSSPLAYRTFKYTNAPFKFTFDWRRTS